MKREILEILRNYAHENAARRRECLEALEDERLAAMEQAQRLLNRVDIIKKLTAAFKSLYDDEPIPEEFIKAFDENEDILPII